MATEEAVSQGIVWDARTGWFTWSNRVGACAISLCWLPPYRRGFVFSAHEDKVVVGSDTGAVTIIDFSGTLDLYRRLSASDGAEVDVETIDG